MTDEKLPWMKFYPSDFMGSPKVRSMKGIQRGIYISLMCKCWEAPDGAIPDDPDELWMECGVTPEQMRDAWPKVRQCFDPHPERDGMLVQPRIQEERGDALERRERARKAGKASGEARRTEQDVEQPVERGVEREAQREVERDDPPMRASDASEAQRDRGTEGTEVQKQRSEDVKSSGAEPRVENSPDDDGESWNDRLAPVVREVAYLGGGPPEDWTLGRCMSRLKQLKDQGYSTRELEDGLRGLRWMVEQEHEAICDKEGTPFIRQGQKFRAVVFNRAEERGMPLLSTAAHHWRKHGEPSANGRSGMSRAAV